VEAATLSAPGGGRSLDERSPLARRIDPAFKGVLTALAAGILVLIVFFFVRLYVEAHPALAKFGVFGFTFRNNWDVQHLFFGAAPLLVGTLITSGLALLIGVPVAIATALFLTELCPVRLRTPLTVAVELLAAVPSVVFGLWGIFVLAPKITPIEKWISDTFSFVPFIGGGTVGPYNYFIAGLILAIMILPIVSAISREVVSTVPREHKEAAYALGATRWEMIRMAVLPYSRAGITGAAMLGLGRAIGETIAVTLVIGNAPTIGKHLFEPGYSLAAVIAAEFGEAADKPLHRAALIAAGLLLFVVTLIINAGARYFVSRSQSTRPGAAAAAVPSAAG